MGSHDEFWAKQIQRWSCSTSSFHVAHNGPFHQAALSLSPGSFYDLCLLLWSIAAHHHISNDVHNSGRIFCFVVRGMCGRYSRRVAFGLHRPRRRSREFWRRRCLAAELSNLFFKCQPEAPVESRMRQTRSRARRSATLESTRSCLLESSVRLVAMDWPQSCAASRSGRTWRERRFKEPEIN